VQAAPDDAITTITSSLWKNGPIALTEMKTLFDTIGEARKWEDLYEHTAMTIAGFCDVRRKASTIVGLIAKPAEEPT
jgi:hypothetical protein